MVPFSLAEDIKKRDPFACPAQEAYLNIMRTQSAVGAPIEQLFKQHGTSPAKYNVLRILRGARLSGESDECGLPSLEIADRLITRVPDITRLVDGLLADGLVTRKRCTEDRRVVYVGITPAGLSLLDKLDEPVITTHQNVLSHMTDDELKLLNELLVKARHREAVAETPGEHSPKPATGLASEESAATLPASDNVADHVLPAKPRRKRGFASKMH